MIAVLREQEAGKVTAEVFRQHGIGEQPLSRWKPKDSRMSVSDAQQLKALQEETSRLEKLLAKWRLCADEAHDHRRNSAPIALSRSSLPGSSRPSGHRARACSRSNKI